MKYLKSAVQLALFAAVAFAVWHFLFPPPEKVIEKRLRALAATISENPAGNISRVANVNRVGGFFHPNASINLEGFGRDVSSVQGRGELEQMAMGLRQNNFRISVSFSNIHIVVDQTKTTATALVTAEVKLNDQVEPVVQDIRLAFEKVDRAWLIRGATPAKTLKID